MEKVITKQELKQKMLITLNRLNDLVKITFGPHGRLVMIPVRNKYLDTIIEKYRLTKDGISVVKSVNKTEDEVENIFITVIKELLNKVESLVGDGTTTTLMLATEIFNNLVQYFIEEYDIDNNSNKLTIIQLKKEIDDLYDKICEYIDKHKYDVKDKNDIVNIVSLSVNNDKELANTIVDAYNTVGADGTIVIDEQPYIYNNTDVVEYVSGFEINSGFISPYFITDINKKVVELKDCYIVVYDGNISTAKQIVKLLEQALDKKVSLLFIANNIEDEALATLIVNKTRNIVQCCAIKAPYVGEKKQDLFEDIAVIAGTRIISPKANDKLTNVQLSELGHAEKVIITKDKTIFVNCDKANKDIIATKIDDLKAKVETTDVLIDKAYLRYRIANLNNKIAVLKLYASNYFDFLEKKDRVEDAIGVIRTLEDGYIVGGGIALYRISEELSTMENTTVSSNQKLRMIFINSLKIQLKQLLYNLIAYTSLDNYALIDNAVIEKYVEKVKKDESFDNGYELTTMRYCDLKESGVIESVKMLKTIIRIAFDIVYQFLVMDGLVYSCNQQQVINQSIDNNFYQNQIE